ncbi:DUF1611 domain-containing protein [Saliterribacillus persicus]|uniref:Putative NAD-dependent epimerase/dehydratase family protein n=1 Tax=Saliterribacillus persicus TaxID=930114 RepID=A0A368YF95_9BACI|nr:DUF1611 domain-containing protein [Saliterribacillus persicus]RCW76854.1 putative NAD-dependent epimerase/dehydratase family protein [Saliterribacillus persicus]
MKKTAIIYCEKNFGEMDGKTANGLIRNSEIYQILGVIDSTKTGWDAGELINKQENGIPVFKNLDEALTKLPVKPEEFIFGLAPADAVLRKEERNILKQAMEKGMNIVNPLQEFLTEDEDCMAHANKFGVTIKDVRKYPKQNELHIFSGEILKITPPRIAILGTDSAVGKRTTAMIIVEKLKEIGINAVFIGTGQTGLIQGAKYAIAIDALPLQFAIGELENQIIKANNEEKPDLFLIEGQGALSHPAYVSSTGILKGSKPNAVIVQHPPKREFLGDFPFIKMPTIKSEIDLIELFGSTKVIAVTLNHENMSKEELEEEITRAELDLQLPVTDILTFGSDKIINKILTTFPALQEKSKQSALN